MSEPAALRADGDRIWVATATEADTNAYVDATLASIDRLREWNPVDPYGLPSLLRAATAYQRTFLVHARDDEGSHGLVGKINVGSIVRGRAMVGTLGYDAFDPYAGRGMFGEGLRLVVDLAFAHEPAGLGLSRIEVNVQPGNVRSAAVVRRLGFRHEGFSPAYLLMPSRGGADRWRDHDRYAVTAAEWPAAPWSPATDLRVCVVLVEPADGTFGPVLAAELGVPHLPVERLGEVAFEVLADSVRGGVLTARDPDDHTVTAGLERAGFDPVQVPVVRLGADPGSGPSPADGVGRLALEVRAAFAAP